MRKFASWDFSKDMINEKNIVASDEFLEEETEVLDNGENRLSNSYGTKKADSVKVNTKLIKKFKIKLIKKFNINLVTKMVLFTILVYFLIIFYSIFYFFNFTF